MPNTVNFGALNWVILFAYIAANLFLGYKLSKKVKSDQDYYLGSKDIPWWAIGISVVATYVSALSFLGGPAWSYKAGMSALAIHLNYPIVVFIVITYFLPFFYRAGVVSIYQYMEERFGPTSRSIMAFVFLMTQALSSATILFATALVITFITGISVSWAIIIVSVIALVYTIMGGMNAVIWTDVIQAGILIIGSVIIIFALLNSFPEGLSATLASLKGEGKTNALNTSFDFTSDTTVWAGVFAMTIYHTTVYGVNQMMVQRTLAAKNIGDAKKSFLMMGYGAFFIYFMFFLMGILLYKYYNGVTFDNSNTIVLQFASDLAIPGLMGILTAAVIAASMSTLDSSLNSLSTVSVVDFYKRFFVKNASASHYLAASRVFTVFWAILIVIPALMFIGSESISILQLLTKLGSYFIGAKISMYALGFFSKDTTEKGLIAGVLIGAVTVWFIATKTNISWPWYPVIGGGVNIVFSILASRLLTGKQQNYHKYTIKGQQQVFKDEQLAEKEGKWYVVPGKVDKASYFLLVFFVFTILFLIWFNSVS